LEKISESKIKEMIEEERAKLKELWKQLHMSDEQIQELLESINSAGGSSPPLSLLFSLFFPLLFHWSHPGKYSFDVLEAMRMEVKTLTERLARMGPLIKLIVRREWIKSEMNSFEKKASEPSRLFGRSTQLLEEEKFRKIVANEFPRLTVKLQKELVKYEVHHPSSSSTDGLFLVSQHWGWASLPLFSEHIQGTVRVSGKALPQDDARGAATAQLCPAASQAFFRSDLRPVLPIPPAEALAYGHRAQRQ